MDKQEVEITQRMTVAALAEAMNKDFGKNQIQRVQKSDRTQTTGSKGDRCPDPVSLEPAQ